MFSANGSHNHSLMYISWIAKLFSYYFSALLPYLSIVRVLGFNKHEHITHIQSCRQYRTDLSSDFYHKLECLRCRPLFKRRHLVVTVTKIHFDQALAYHLEIKDLVIHWKYNNWQQLVSHGQTTNHYIDISTTITLINKRKPGKNNSMSKP